MYLLKNNRQIPTCNPKHLGLDRLCPKSPRTLVCIATQNPPELFFWCCRTHYLALAWMIPSFCCFDFLVEGHGPTPTTSESSTDSEKNLINKPTMLMYMHDHLWQCCCHLFVTLTFGPGLGQVNNQGFIIYLIEVTRKISAQDNS